MSFLPLWNESFLISLRYFKTVLHYGICIQLALCLSISLWMAVMSLYTFFLDYQVIIAEILKATLSETVRVQLRARSEAKYGVIMKSFSDKIYDSDLYLQRATEQLVH